MLSRIPTFRRVGHVSLPVHFVASHELHGRFKCRPESHSTSAIFTATAFPSPTPPCHFLCTSHVSSPTSPPDSQMLSRLRCAHFGTFAALTRSLSAFHFFVCPSGGTAGNRLILYFPKSPKALQSDIFYFYCMSLLHHPKTHQSTYGQQSQLKTQVVLPRHSSSSLAILLSPKVLAP
jgi:hypothetical protein